MIRLAVLTMLVAAAPEVLVYRATSTGPKPTDGVYTYDFEITGPEALTKQLRGSNPVLSVEQLRVTRKGRQQIAAGPNNDIRVELLFDTAHVDGKANGKPFQFDFDSKNPPADLASDPVRMVSWGLGMGNRTFLLGPKGNYSTADSNQDAQAEATGVIVDAPVRLPDNPVAVGAQWTTEWAGTRKQKNNGAGFRYKQTAKLEEIVPGPSPRARISFATTGTLDIPPDKNPQGELTTLDAKGSILLDMQTGVVARADSAGAITTELKTAGLKLIRRMSAKFGTP